MAQLRVKIYLVVFVRQSGSFTYGWGTFSPILRSMAPRNVARAEEFFCGIGIKIITGSRYLGGFVGDRAAKDS